jgi:hypothetical protein
LHGTTSRVAVNVEKAHMAAENENGTPPIVHRVETNIRSPMEATASVQAIRPVNVEIITEIATALEKLRPHVTDTELLDATVAAAHEYEKGGLTPEAFNNAWMAVLIGLSLILAKHLAASAGDDLGHAVAQEFIHALTRLLNY